MKLTKDKIKEMIKEALANVDSVPKQPKTTKDVERVAQTIEKIPGIDAMIEKINTIDELHGVLNMFIGKVMARGLKADQLIRVLIKLKNEHVKEK